GTAFDVDLHSSFSCRAGGSDNPLKAPKGLDLPGSGRSWTQAPNYTKRGAKRTAFRGRSAGRFAPENRGENGPERRSSDMPRQQVRQELDLLLEHVVLDAQRLDAAAGMQHRGVVAAAEAPADFGQRACRELARQVHRDLPRPGDAPGALRRLEVAHVELVVLGGLALDVLDRGL